MHDVAHDRKNFEKIIGCEYASIRSATGWMINRRERCEIFVKARKWECRLSGVSHCGAAAKVPDAPTSKSATHDALETRARPDQSRTTPLSIHRSCRARRYTLTNILIFPFFLSYTPHPLLISTTRTRYSLSHAYRVIIRLQLRKEKRESRYLCLYRANISCAYRCIFFFHALVRIRERDDSSKSSTSPLPPPPFTIVTSGVDRIESKIGLKTSRFQRIHCPFSTYYIFLNQNTR